MTNECDGCDPEVWRCDKELSSIAVPAFAEMRYVASGNTYPHRETFISWVWHWNPERRSWIEDNGSRPDEPCIRVIRDLPGVTVVEEPLD